MARPGRDQIGTRNGVRVPSPGDDVIKAGDGAPDEINCGTGNDVAHVDSVEDGLRLREGARAMNAGRRPDTDPPALPDPPTVVATPCGSAATVTGAEHPKPHDLSVLESSGYLERLGFEVERPGLDQLFPDARYGPPRTRDLGALSAGSGRRNRSQARKRAPNMGPLLRKDVPPAFPYAGPSVLQVFESPIGASVYNLNTRICEEFPSDHVNTTTRGSVHLARK